MVGSNTFVLKSFFIQYAHMLKFYILLAVINKEWFASYCSHLTVLTATGFAHSSCLRQRGKSYIQDVEHSHAQRSKCAELSEQ